MTTDSGYEVRRLEIVQPPIPPGGGIVELPGGRLIQIANGDPFEFLACLDFPGVGHPARGNHYHAKKVERIYVVKGILAATLVNVDTGAVMEFRLEQHDLLTVRPRYAHAYLAQTPTLAVEFSTFAYDPTDTIPFQVLQVGS